MQNEGIRKQKRVVLLFTYFAGYLVLFQLLVQKFLYQKIGMSGYFILDALVNAIMMLFFVFLLNDWLADQWQIFQRELRKNIVNVLSTVGYLYLVTILFSLLIAAPFHLSEAENQINNELMMKSDLFGFLFSSLIIAPFVEEMVFRACIYHPAFKKWGFLGGAVLSALIFGSLHIGASVMAGNWINLLYMINYGLCGFVLCLSFYRSTSIWTSVFAHALFNLIGVVFMFL